ncbi:MAG: DUF6197 family protein, partial [Pseudonocardia sp.]
MSHQTTDLIPVFRRAAEVIQTNGHHQGAYYDLSTPSTMPPADCPVCTAGALSVAVTGNPVPPEDLDGVLGFAVEFLSERVYAATTDEDPIERVASWNDGIGVGQVEVVDELLRAAGELADAHCALVPVGVQTSDGSRWRLASTVRGMPRYVLSGMPTDAPLGVQVELGELAERFGAPSAWGGPRAVTAV